MNEGWASHWHHRIMNAIDLPQGIQLEFMVRHNQVVSPHPGGLNPYHVGYRRLARHREALRRRGHPGGTAEDDGGPRDGPRRQSFLRRFLTEELMRELDLFSWKPRGEHLVVDADLGRGALGGHQEPAAPQHRQRRFPRHQGRRTRTTVRRAASASSTSMTAATSTSATPRRRSAISARSGATGSISRPGSRGSRRSSPRGRTASTPSCWCSGRLPGPVRRERRRRAGAVRRIVAARRRGGKDNAASVPCIGVGHPAPGFPASGAGRDQLRPHQLGRSGGSRPRPLGRRAAL